ncbi:MAG: hypothetical protein V1921_03455 [Candidatus Altiarchaeota archaeon]
MDHKIGSWAFLVGIVVSVLAGLAIERNVSGAPPSNFAAIAAVLTVLGLIVGYVNITPGEATLFLVATMTLIVASSSVILIPFVGAAIKYILTSVIVFCSSAAVVVALKTIYALAAEK